MPDLVSSKCWVSWNCGKYNKPVLFRGKKVPNILEDATIKRIADKHKKSPAHVALKFLLQRNIVVIPKSVTPKRVKDNINLFDFTLDQDDIKDLQTLEVGEPARVCDFSFSSA